MYCLPFLTSAQMVPPDFISPNQERFVHNIMHLVRYDQGEEASVLFQRHTQHPPSSPPPTNDEVEGGPPIRRRRYASRAKVLSAVPEVLMQEAGIARADGLQALENAVSERGLFQYFSDSMLSDGFVQWRKHSEEQNVVIMNDYSTETGVLKPLDYVHVTACETESGEMQIKCTCKFYQLMQSRALQRANLQEDVDTVLPTNFTCMHCRFYAQHLVPLQNHLFSQDSINRLHDKVKQTEEAMNYPLTLLGEASPHGTTKFSACGGDGYSIINLSFTSSGCIASCQSGTCQAKYSHTYRRKIPKYIPLDSLSQDGMCDHLFTVFQNKPVLDVLFPAHFQSDPTPGDDRSDDEEDLGPAPDADLVNPDDFGIRNREPGTISFDAHEGKWQSTSHSTLKTKDDRFDPDLVRAAEKRLKFLAGDLTPQGYRVGPSVTSLPPPVDNVPSRCECGQSFIEILTRKTLIYTRQVGSHSCQSIDSCQYSCRIYPFNLFPAFRNRANIRANAICICYKFVPLFYREFCSVKSKSPNVQMATLYDMFGMRQIVFFSFHQLWGWGRSYFGIFMVWLIMASFLSLGSALI